MNLLLLAVAPTMTILFYIYIRDKYEKEPLFFLFTGTLYGVLIAFPISFTGNFIEAAAGEKLSENVLFLSFVTAAFTEEIFKFIILTLLCFESKHYNEFFDGIVYAVFISLGFAGFENILYVFHPMLGGMRTAVLRAFLSVPAHALFGVSMGYFLSAAKFKKSKNAALLAFLIPFIKHGLFDLILMSDYDKYYIIFACFTAYLWYDGFRKMKRASQMHNFMFWR